MAIDPLRLQKYFTLEERIEKENKLNVLITSNYPAYNDAELEAAQGQVVISDLVLELTSKLFNALGASASTTTKQLDRFWRNARVVSSHNPVVYKEKVIGDWEVNREPLPFVWQIGTSPKVGAA
mgnify:CR=1 FL=1